MAKSIAPGDVSIAKLQTGYVIVYMYFPIIWAYKLQIEIVLGTPDTKYIIIVFIMTLYTFYVNIRITE